MVDLARFSNLALPDGFRLIGVKETDAALIDPIGRPVVQQKSLLQRALYSLLQGVLKEMPA